MSATVLDVSSREEGGKKVFLQGELAALRSIPVVGKIVDDLLKDPASEVDGRLLSLVEGQQTMDGSVRTVEMLLPAQSVMQSGLVGMVGGSSCKLTIEASTAKWRSSAAKRLYRVSVTQ